VIYENNFDDDPTGVYTEANLDADWKTPPGENGVEEGRISIVDGADAFSGKSMAVQYPEGLHRPQNTGGQWQLEFDHGYNEMFVEYRVKFGEGFDFVRGGKLHGLYGGEGNTGGNRPDGTDGFSARMHWRTDGSTGSPLTDTGLANMTQYLYHPDQPDDTGDDFRWDDSGNGDWELFESGRWYHLRHRVVMNTVVDGVGQHDGIVQGWLDGEMVFDVRNIRFRDVTTFDIDGFYFSTFFGGTGERWNTSKDEVAFFDDFLITVPEGAEPVTPQGNFVAVQAEDFTSVTDPNNDGDTYIVVEDDEALGGEAITTRSGSRTNVPDEPHDAIASYSLTFDEPGTYTSYYRAHGTSGSSDSFFSPSAFGSDPTNNEGTANAGEYEWATGESFTITAADVGVAQELRIGRREGLNRIDAIMLHEDVNLTDAELDLLVTGAESALLGDVNLDGTVNFLDISPFIGILTASTYQNEADLDQNGAVDFLDISPFISALSAQ